MATERMDPATFRTLRKRAHLQQAELAAILGYTPQHISRFEQGVYPIPHSVAIAMAWIDVFGPSDPFDPDWRPRFAA